MDQYIEAFQPDIKLLFVRHPEHNLASLKKKFYAPVAGTMDAKFEALEDAYRRRETLFDEVRARAPFFLLLCPLNLHVATAVRCDTVVNGFGGRGSAARPTRKPLVNALAGVPPAPPASPLPPTRACHRR